MEKLAVILQKLYDFFTRTISDDHVDINVSVADFTPANEYLNKTFRLYVGTEGIVKGITPKGTAITRKLVVGYHPITFTRITSTGTTATDLAALF